VKTDTLKKSPSIGGSPAHKSESVLRKQYARLGRQIPLMYILMFLNVAFLSLIRAGMDTGWAISARHLRFRLLSRSEPASG
jgi:hypothetical protein